MCKQQLREEHVRSKIVRYIEMQAIQEISNYFLCEQEKESIPAHFVEKEASFCYIKNWMLQATGKWILKKDTCKDKDKLGNVPGDHKLYRKDVNKRNEGQCNKIKLWNMMVRIVSIIIRYLRIVPKPLKRDWRNNKF